MNHLFVKQISRIATASIVLTIASSACAQSVRRISTFATGTDVNATQPDSIAVSKNSLWVSYGNGADSTGLSGSSSVVQYKRNGKVKVIAIGPVQCAARPRDIETTTIIFPRNVLAVSTSPMLRWFVCGTIRPVCGNPFGVKAGLFR